MTNAGGADVNEPAFMDWEPSTPPSSPPPAATLDWVESQLGRKVRSFEALKGGLSSAVHRLRFAEGDDVVLRRYTLTDWIEREPYIPHDEAFILTKLGQLDVGTDTPELLAADPDGNHGDVPAVVMTVVSGSPDINPDEPTSWAERLAESLAKIHRQPEVEGLSGFRRWDDPDRPLPTWTTQPEVWRQAINLRPAELPAHPRVFIHRDYHPNNIHWDDAGEICAIVDWLSACNGPVAADLSHCRWNLAILFDPALAHHFTEHYRQLTGYSEDLQAFDLATVLSGPVGPFPTFAWNALGRADLTSDSVAPKIDNWLQVIVED